MKRFSQTVVQIKNADGDFEPIAALRGLSSYELAVQNGFEGTEQEWLETMLSDGWVGKYQELETNKANKSDVYTTEQVDELVGGITAKHVPVSDDVANRFGVTDDALTVDDALGKCADDFKKIFECGTYVGTGTFGADNPTVLSFNGKPMIVAIVNLTNNQGVLLCFTDSIYSSINTLFSSNITAYLTWGDNSISFYHHEYPAAQANASGTTYRYMALCQI